MTKPPRNTGLGKRFRKALETRFKTAVTDGKDQVTIAASDLIKDLGDEGVNRAPSCCRVMKNALTDSDEIVHSSASGETPALKITYVIPRPKPEKIPMPDVWPFVPGKTYHRRNYIHRVYGGQQQGGISTPLKRRASSSLLGTVQTRLAIVTLSSLTDHSITQGKVR